jgi:hypothetical protein
MSSEKTEYVKVVDRAGNEFICPVNALKNPDLVDEDDLKNCFDSAKEAFSDEEALSIIRNDLKKID